MKKVINHKLYISSTAEHYLLLTNVTRVELPDDNLADNGFKLTIVFQQPQSGGLSVDGWPKSVSWVNAVQSVADGPNAITICNLVTVDRGRSWIVELQPVGQPTDSGNSIPDGTEPDQLLVFNQTGASTGWQPGKLKASSLSIADSQYQGTSRLLAFSNDVYYPNDVNKFVPVNINVTSSPYDNSVSLFLNVQNNDGYLFTQSTGIQFEVGSMLTGSWVSGYLTFRGYLGPGAPASFSVIVPNLTGGAVSGFTATSSTDDNIPFNLIHGDVIIGQPTVNYIGVRLSRDQPNSLALRNGITSQMFSVYNTSSSSNANYRRLRSFWSSTSLAAISAEAAGSLASSNISIAIAPLGTGGFRLSTDGDNRGIYSVDLQRHRTASNQVASGAYSTILGGQNNRCSGQFSFALGSYGATVTSSYSGIIGNRQNPTLSGDYTVVLNNHTSANIMSQCSVLINNNFSNPSHKYSTVLCAPHDDNGFKFGYGLINFQYKYLARMNCSGVYSTPGESVLSAPFAFSSGITVVPQALFITLYLQFWVTRIIDQSDPDNPVTEEIVESQIRTYVGTYNQLDGSVTFGAPVSVHGATAPTTYFGITITSGTNSSPIAATNGYRVLSFTGNLIDPTFIGSVSVTAIIEATYSPG